ncbi:MAG: OsmC family protein [Rikenellaceae bacterium]|nr:OsmC family protein [Rikenellaceae bacterium]
MQIVKLELSADSRFRPIGGRNLSDYNPKELMLAAIADCAGRTALSIMEKMRLEPVAFEIDVEGTLDTGEVRAESRFTALVVTYNVTCLRFEDQDRISHALELTHDKHCGLVAMMRRVAPVDRRILIHSIEGENK